MDFWWNSENIKIELTPKATVIQEDSLLFSEETIYHKISSLIKKETKTSFIQTQLEKEGLFNASLYSIELLLRWDDYYLINNIKLFIDKLSDSLIYLTAIKFQDITSNNWEWAYFFNPDNKEIITRTEETVSIFCVGITNYIKFNFLLNTNLQEDDEELPQISAWYQLIKKISIYSQYIYSIPNATFLMTWWNLNNFFWTIKQKYINTNSNNQLHLNWDNIIIDTTTRQTPVTGNIDNSFDNISDNYLCSLYLTATSMIQARLFIQAWELFTTMEKYIISNKDISWDFIKILFELNSTKHGDSLGKSPASFFLTKVEFIKAITMFDHGHIHIFLMCLKNSINIFFSNDYSSITETISWTKVNEICNDKYYIQHFLQEYGEKWSDILIMFIKDKNEILKCSVFKIFEFMVEYSPTTIFKYISKWIKYLFKISYSTTQVIKDANGNSSITNNNNNISALRIVNVFKDKKVFFPIKAFNSFKTQGKPNKNNHEINTTVNRNSSISQIWQKQINYTIDTIINAIHDFRSDVIADIWIKSNKLLFAILFTTNRETLVHINAVKLLRKCYMNINTLDYTEEDKQNIWYLFVISIKLSVKTSFKDYLILESGKHGNSKNKAKSKHKTSKEFKDSLQNTNYKNNILSTWLNNYNILENNENGNWLQLIVETICDDNKSEQDSFWNWINEMLIIIIDYIKTPHSEPYNTGINEEEFEFCLFYWYTWLQFLISIYFPSQDKIEIKRQEYLFNTNSTVGNVIWKLVDTLFIIEEFTWTNYKAYILFELVLDILLKISRLYGNVLTPKFSYDKMFITQYQTLYSFIRDHGLFNTNINYLLKTLPWCDMTNAEFNNELIKIFNLFLKNFRNYYTEDSFSLLSLLMDKLGKSDNIDNMLFNSITKAILNKSSYKGNSFKQCYDKYHEIIFHKHEYFVYMVQEMKNNFKLYISSMQINNNNKIKCKELYLEFIDRLDWYRRYYEYVKDAIGNTSNKWDKIRKIINNILLVDEETVFLLNEIGKILDDTTIYKINIWIESNVKLFEIPTISGIDNKELFEVCWIQCKLYLNFIIHVNELTFNQYWINENIKIISCIIGIINKMNKYNYPVEVEVYAKLIQSLNYTKVSNIKIKSVNENIWQMLSLIVVPWRDDEDSLRNQTIYYSELITLLSKCWDNREEMTILFVCEMLFKLFNIKFEQGKKLDLYQIKAFIKYYSANDGMKMFNVVWEKIILLLYGNINYKIKVICNFITQLLIPECEWFCWSGKQIAWLSPDNVEEMYICIRDKIIPSLINKEQNDDDNSKDELNTNSMKYTESDGNGINNTSADENMDYYNKWMDKGFKVDEISDDINEENEDDEDDNYEDYTEDIITRNTNNTGNWGNINNMISNTKPVNTLSGSNDINQETLNANKWNNVKPPDMEVNSKNIITNKPQEIPIDDDNLSWEDLGVVEVGDEIFENFDEENIPILKYNCVRSKGVAAKWKTNQTARSLLMSEYQPNQKKSYPQKSRTQMNIEEDEENDGINEEFSDDVPDLSTKKKNIRPWNGLRPATPPWRNNKNMNKQSKSEVDDDQKEDDKNESI